MAEARVGTSGWSYQEWVRSFYPLGMQPSRMLAFYARRFDAVEAHSTYRRLPTAATLERWIGDVPEWFRFAPKAHLGITHQRDMEGLADRVAAFAAAVAPLGERLGPVLFSLPHQTPDLDRLERLLKALPAKPNKTKGAGGPGLQAAFELGPGWITPEVLGLLQAHDATLALVETDARPAPDIEVGPFTYVRLRSTRYTRSDLDNWAGRVAKARADGRDMFLFFKHDELGDGPRYARRLMGRLRQAS